MDSQFLKVCVTGAAGHIASAFYPLLGCGQVFGERTEIELTLLELPEKLNELKGVKMQIEDCAFQLVKSVTSTSDCEIAFKDIDVGIFLGGFPRKPGMERSDLLQINNEIFKQQAKMLQMHAKETARILVVANPSNTNCLTLAENCPKIPKKNFTSLMQLDHNRCTAMIASKVGVPIDKVRNLIVWGNHSLTQFPDISHCLIDGKPASEVIDDPQYQYETFVTQAQKRGSMILSIARQTSFLSAACAVKDHLRNWYLGTDKITSMGVITDGNAYDIPAGFCFSMPVICKNFDYEVVKDLELDSQTRKRLITSLKELENEKEEAQLQ